MVEEADWEAWRAEREGEIYEWDMTEEEQELAQQDLKLMRSYVKRAPKRRAVPEGSAPLELWHQLLYPNWRASQQTGGVGYDASMPKVPGFWWIISVGLAKIRHFQKAPLYWHRSRGAGLPKSAQHGPRGKRVVHVLLVFGKAFYSRMLTITPSQPDHGSPAGGERPPFSSPR